MTTETLVGDHELSAVLDSARTESGTTLLALTHESPVLLVFLRHFGCPFGRKTLNDVSDLTEKLTSRGVRPVFVHMGTPELAAHYFDYYRLSEVERVSDPEAVVYRHPAFALALQSPWRQLVSPTVWAGWLKGALARYGVGKFEGDGRQMPGIFFLKGAAIVRSFRYKTIADQPDYLKLIQ